MPPRKRLRRTVERSEEEEQDDGGSPPVLAHSALEAASAVISELDSSALQELPPPPSGPATAWTLTFYSVKVLTYSVALLKGFETETFFALCPDGLTFGVMDATKSCMLSGLLHVELEANGDTENLMFGVRTADLDRVLSKCAVRKERTLEKLEFSMDQERSGKLEVVIRFAAMRGALSCIQCKMATLSTDEDMVIDPVELAITGSFCMPPDMILAVMGSGEQDALRVMVRRMGGVRVSMAGKRKCDEEEAEDQSVMLVHLSAENEDGGMMQISHTLCQFCRQTQTDGPRADFRALHRPHLSPAFLEQQGATAGEQLYNARFAMPLLKKPLTILRTMPVSVAFVGSTAPLLLEWHFPSEQSTIRVYLAPKVEEE